MRNALHVLTDELRRLKASGVKTVHVPDETLAALRRALRMQSGERKTEGGKPIAESGLRIAESRTSEPTTAVVATQSASGSWTPPPTKSEIKNPKSEIKTLPPPPVFTLPEGDRATRWAWLRDRVLCDPVCVAHVRPGKKVVFGVGSIDAQIMFVGEAPGADEEVQGEPFVGPAGQLLTRMIQAMGLQRQQVYIGNIMNWRPELPSRADGTQVGNREPTLEEIAFCLPFITAQIDVVSPAIIVALGATAARGLLGPHNVRTMGDVRGRWHDFRGRPLRVTYHPSYLLRKVVEGKIPEQRAKRAAWEDYLAVMERAVLPITDKQRSFFLQ